MVDPARAQVTSPQPRVRRLPRGRPPAGRVLWRAARLALGTASALGLARFAYGLLLPAMRAELGWSLAQAGALTTANGLGYLVGALAAAPAARRLGEAVTFRLGMVLTVAALAGTALSGDYLLLLITRAAAGVAGALVFIAGGVIASHLAAASRSAAPVAIYFSGPGLGIALSGAAIPAALGHHPGRWPLVWAGLAAAAAVAALSNWTAVSRVGAGLPTAAMSLHGIRRLWPIATAYLLFGAGYISYITFLSAYLAGQRAGVLQLSLTWVLLGLAAVTAPAVWSGPITRRPASRVLALLLALIGTAAALDLVSPSPAAVIGSALIYGATFLSVPATLTGLIRDAAPPTGWTGVLAVFTVLFGTGQMAGPSLAGALADQAGAGATLAWTAVLCLAGAGLTALTRGGKAAPATAPTRTDSHDPGV